MSKMTGAASFCLAVVVWSGCPSNNVDDGDEGSSGGSRIGQACVLDSDCNGAICSNGICTAPGSSSGTTSGGSSAAASSSSGGGSSGSTASSSEVDAGTPDLYVPHGHVITDPAAGPIDFGAQRLCQSVEKTILVTNTGDATVSIVSLGFRNNTSGEFSLAVVGGPAPTSMAPGAQFTVRVRHTPTDAAPDRAYFSLVTSADNPLVEIELVAEFKGDAALTVHRLIEDTGVSITTLTMPPAALNATSTAHVFVKNTGSADSALTVTAVAFDPAVSPDFSVNAGLLPRPLSTFGGAPTPTGGCGTAGADAGIPDASTVGADAGDGGAEDGGAGDGGTVVAPQEVLDIALTFTANQAGPATTELVITATVGQQTVTHRVSLSALGQIGRLVADPDPLDFGEVFINRTKTASVRIRNDGNALAELTGISFQYNQPAWQLDLTGLTFPFPLTPSSYMDLPVTFAPASLVAYSNFIIVTVNGGQPTDIEVSGLGVNEPAIQVPDTLDFGDVYVGTPKALTLTVGNTAAGLLRINRFYVDGAGTPPFNFTPTTLTDPIPLAGSATITVTYIPPGLGADDLRDLVIESNDPDLPAARVHLRGHPVRPVANIAPRALDFGFKVAGSGPYTDTFIITNLGAGDLQVNCDLIPRDSTNTVQPDFTVTASRALPTTVLQGGADRVTFTVQYRPTSGLSAAAVHIVTSDPAAAAVDVTMVGSGADCPPRANATVVANPDNTCTYTCVADYHACGNTCLLDTSPDSCGTLCTPCEARTGATRGCTAATSTCTYACINPNYDLNGDINAAQGGSNGCEYACDVTTQGAETCDGHDNNCNGTVDDGAFTDANDPGASCGTGAGAYNLGNLGWVGQGGLFSEWTDFSVFPQGDTDWFRIYADDVSGTCIPLWDSKSYRFTIQLQQVPAANDFDLHTKANSCADSGATSANGPGTNEEIVYTWGGTCAFDASQDFHIRVYPYTQPNPNNSCYKYKLRVRFERWLN
ncbi:MAG: choice-of-anchor D domain-containing protein [Deltaproteobacteria bacterium]|nr:choice-of-anchor D domain-containing protein [Deltaproteobacteria bacterium]